MDILEAEVEDVEVVEVERCTVSGDHRRVRTSIVGLEAAWAMMRISHIGDVFHIGRDIAAAW